MRSWRAAVGSRRRDGRSRRRLGRRQRWRWHGGRQPSAAACKPAAPLTRPLNAPYASTHLVLDCRPAPGRWRHPPAPPGARASCAPPTTRAAAPPLQAGAPGAACARPPACPTGRPRPRRPGGGWRRPLRGGWARAGPGDCWASRRRRRRGARAAVVGRVAVWEPSARLDHTGRPSEARREGQGRVQSALRATGG